MLDSLAAIINKFIPDPEQAQKMVVEMEKEMTKQMEMQSNIIQSEQKNGSGKWRVRLMYLCMVMVALHFVMYDIVPYIRTVFDLDFWTPSAPVDTEFWSFLRIGVGGYIGSRGIEKSIAHFKGK